MTLLYLSADDIAALALTPAEILAATESILRHKNQGRTWLKPKLAVESQPGHIAQAMVGVAADPPVAALKWVGISASNAGTGLPPIHATVILSDARTGAPRTIMSGNWITGVRTAACSAAAARYLARPDSATIAFLGCGLQAHTHLDALRPLFPGLRHALLLGRSPAPVQRLAAAVEAAGLIPRIVTRPADAVAADILISTIPAGPELRPFLDLRLLPPGAFLSAVDLGRAWYPGTWRETFDIIATDDIPQSTELGASGKMAFPGPFDTEIGGLLDGTHPGRTGAAQRTALVFAGMALADLGLAALIDSRARAAGIGRVLPA